MNTQTLKLNTPIRRGDNEVTAITLHKPNVSAMRGISLNSLLNMNVDAIVETLPRISDPKILPAEIEKMDCADLLQSGILIASFFLQTSDQEGME